MVHFTVMTMLTVQTPLELIVVNVTLGLQEMGVLVWVSCIHIVIIYIQNRSHYTNTPNFVLLPAPMDITLYYLLLKLFWTP